MILFNRQTNTCFSCGLQVNNNNSFSTKKETTNNRPNSSYSSYSSNQSFVNPVNITGKKFFSTTAYLKVDNHDIEERNKKLFEIDESIKTASHLENEKLLSKERLFDLLKQNKQESLDNCHSAELSMIEAQRLCAKASNLLTKNKDSLTYEKRKEVESNLNLGGLGQSYPSHNTEEEKSLNDIERCQKKLMGAIFRAKSVEEVVPNPLATDNVVNQANALIKELNTLSENIHKLTHNNDRIRTELLNRKSYNLH